MKPKHECLHWQDGETCQFIKICRFGIKTGSCTVSGDLTGQSTPYFKKKSKDSKTFNAGGKGGILFFGALLLFMSCAGSLAIVEPVHVSSEPIYLEMIPGDLKAVCVEIKETHGFSFELIYNLVKTESNWNRWALGRNSNGTEDRGLCQLNSGNNWKIDHWDAVENLKAGFGYLAKMVKKFDSLEIGLVAYNAGPGRVLRGTAPEISKKYARKILGI